MIHRSGSWLALSLVGAVAGLQVVGALRGALLLVAGPLSLLFVGTTFVFVSEGVRLLHQSPTQLQRAMRSLAAAATAIAIAWSVVVLMLPDAIGSRLLGATWQQAKPLLPLLVPWVLAVGASMGAIQGLFALGAARRSLFTQAAGLAASLPSMTAAAALAGARGAALAGGLSAVFGTVLAWFQFRRALSEPITSVDAGSPEQIAPLEVEVSERALPEVTAG
jgi:O-antigen/teichoic acid export membrane protein